MGILGFEQVRDPNDAVTGWDGRPETPLDCAHRYMFDTEMPGGLKSQAERRADKWPQRGRG